MHFLIMFSYCFCRLFPLSPWSASYYLQSNAFLFPQFSIFPVTYNNKHVSYIIYTWKNMLKIYKIIQIFQIFLITHIKRWTHCSAHYHWWWRRRRVRALNPCNALSPLLLTLCCARQKNNDFLKIIKNFNILSVVLISQ